MNTLNGLPMHIILVHAVVVLLPLSALLLVLTAVYDVYKIGDSGAKASWDGKVSSASYIAG